MFFTPPANAPPVAEAGSAASDLNEAYRKGVEGRVLLVCKVTSSGDLTDCRTEKEDPVGMGFGEAALKMSSQFKMRRRTASAEPVEGGTVRIPLKFKLPPGAPPKGQ